MTVPETLICEVNAPDIRQAYLEALNRCFPGWGDDAQFSWCFDRKVGGPKADLLTIRMDGVLIAGSGITYRRIQLPNDNTVLIGIMTGSWTLSDARGKGCFSRMIQESVALTRATKGALLIAFVREDNASYRRFLAAGAAAFPSWYVASTRGTPSGRMTASRSLHQRDAKFSLEPILSRRDQNGAGHARVTYTVPQWRSQFLQRGDSCFLLEGEMGWAAVETAGDVERVQATAFRRRLDPIDLLAALLSFARGRERELFLFSMEPAVIKAAEELGLAGTPGFLTALVADSDVLAKAMNWNHPLSPANSRLLAQVDSEWHLGDWRIEAGDRM